MELVLEHRALIATLFGILALLFLILRVRMHAFAALLLVAIFSALAAGMAPELAFDTVQKGMGGTLGFIAPVIGLGALFGAILEASGAVQALAQKVSRLASVGKQRWAMGGLGLVAATPVFFDVALIILMPFITALSSRAGRLSLVFGLPLCAGLAVGHAFIPPTPGPIAIAELIGADLGWVIVFGAVTGLVSVAIAGPLLSWALERSGKMPGQIEILAEQLEHQSETARVSFGNAGALIALPLILILLGTLGQMVLPSGLFRDIIAVTGHPFSALLIASGITYVLLAPKTASDRARLGETLTRAFEPTGIVILVTGAGGAFKQVLVDTGAGAQLAEGILSFGFSPILAGFILALLVRLAQGSATVAMITAAGLAAPIVAAANLSAPELGLVTIAIAAGASGFSHVNDSGFWLVSRLFQINEAETLRTWTLSTGLIAITGLISVLLLSLLV